MKSSSASDPNRSYWAAVRSCWVAYFAFQGGLTFEFVCKTAWSATIQMEAPEQYIAMVLYILIYVQVTQTVWRQCGRVVRALDL